MEILSFLNKLFCSHVVLGNDLGERDSDGMVKWPCSKCGKVFKADCGLHILGPNVKCGGQWGEILKDKIS